AYYVRLSGRSEYFFNQKRMNTAQLDADTVLVKSEGKDLYLDPATKFAPYGLMSWPETGVAGLRLDKQAGTWIQTEIPESSTCKVVRQADLKLNEEGGLEGQVKVTYTGLEALDKRLGQRFGDETQGVSGKCIEGCDSSDRRGGIEEQTGLGQLRRKARGGI